MKNMKNIRLTASQRRLMREYTATGGTVQIHYGRGRTTISLDGGCRTGLAEAVISMQREVSYTTDDTEAGEYTHGLEAEK